jgi:hypothetical protein
MEPTEQAKQWLKEYLYQALTYRETFDEVYDHMLLALEHQEAPPSSESTVYQIIDEDFGGSVDMLNMEVDCKDTTNREVKLQYWYMVASWFKRPLIAYTVMIFGLMFFAISLNIKVIKIGIALFGLLVVIVLPIILISVRSFKMGRVYGDTKESIRDSAFRWLIYGFFLTSLVIIRPVFKFLNSIVMHIFHYQSNKVLENSIPGHILATISFMIFIIHFLSLVKLYRDEFKTQMIVN